ncbi:MAG: BCCT family transporter [Brevundimonas sp.]|jgi:choline/glycine/proline betaine transport protein|uniref:BCCT family transporter n=1 Tax=Brevundimonas sp. TaxID=1871086 RepID=UPI0017A8D31B|nr:BCCT family transporter [Brevundimonas sp.]MBA4805454.1 BCCT family transporter [Brevundimonas sp.]
MLKSRMNPRVFWGASLIIGGLLAAAVAAPASSDRIFQAAQAWVIGAFGWFYIAAVAGFLLTVIGLALAPTGRLRLGADDAEPDFPWLSWIAMLFAAGMGIGLMYFAVAEPVQHYIAPPDVEPRTFDAAREAMVITFFHYGVHAWAIYALVGLSLAYFAWRKGLPLTLRSGLFPLLGRRIHGPLGDAVDIFAIWGTVFGIATSLGFGVAQINSGLNYLVGLPVGAGVQVGLIALVMGAAMISVLTGLDRGVRRLSELNLVLAVLLMVFVLAVGPTGFLLKAVFQNLGLYLDEFFVRTFNQYAYEPRGWMANWTLFYWAWWIAWSPFVGMFIARISRGRTVREFILGVLLVPAGFTFLWMTVFGNTAIALDMGGAQGAISAAVSADLSTAIFRFFEYLPGTAITSTIAVLLVAVFFVTSADSGSLVIDTIASGGADETPRWQRVYWCSIEGLAAALLLLAGGLGALQAATLVSALPFTAIMILLAFGLVRQMNADRQGVPLGKPVPPLGERLKRILAPARRRDVDRQIEQHAGPALEAVRRGLEAEGVPDATVERDADGVSLSAPAGGLPFAYRIAAVARPLPAFTALEAPEPRRTHEWRLVARAGPGDRGRDVTGFTTEQLIADVLERLEQQRRAHRPGT